MAWDTFLNSSGNPRIPTFGEAMGEALTLAEAARLTAELRPRSNGVLVSNGPQSRT